MQFLEKLWKMWENRDIKLSQQKEEETIWCQNQIIILKSFSPDVETSNYEFQRPFPENEKVIGLKKDHDKICQNRNKKL